MALRTADDDPSLNPGQQHANQEFDALKRAETKGTVDSTDGDVNNTPADSVKEAEESPSGSWKNEVSGNKPSSSKASGRFSFVKKKGPLGLIITIVLGGGLGLATFFSPGLLIIQIKEMMVNKFNSQLTSMDVRATKILTAKTTGGMLCKSLNVGCKYSSMSEKQIANFEKAGITVEPGEKTILGRTKPKSFEFNGNKIKAADFATEIGSNPEFRAAIKTAYNPKFAGFADSFWGKAASKLGISKAKANIDTSSDEKALKSIQEDTKEGVKITEESNTKPVVEGDPKPEGGIYTAEEAAAANKVATSAEKIGNEIMDGAKTVESKASKAATVALELGENVGSALKVTGHLDLACTAYGAVQAVGYAAKTVRVLQLAKYAMIFLNVADQIKAGVAKPEDVSYLGTILTTEAVGIKAATDSFGYKFAAYGERGIITTTASQFLAGGGLTGELIGFTNKINSVLGGSPKKTCGILRNPFVAGGSLIVGIALFFVPGVNIAIGAKDIALAASGIAFTIAAAFLPAMLKDIVAGVLVDKTTVGEAAGDAITSGSSGMMSTAAAAGGNAPLTPEQAVAYNNLSNNITSQYAEEDRLAYSPFDITNRNTFMGSIVAKLIPYASKMSSLSGFLSSVASLVTGSLASITSQNTKADDSLANYEMCQDFDYNDLIGDGSKVRVATDPYCNVTYGIPPEALNANPVDVANALASQIDPTTGDPLPDTDYAKFITDCIDRNRPLGDSGQNLDESNGSECLFGANVTNTDGTVTTNNNYYIHYIDQRVSKGMDGEDPVLAAAEASGQSKNISFYSNSGNYNTTAFNVGGN